MLIWACDPSCERATLIVNLIIYVEFMYCRSHFCNWGPHIVYKHWFLSLNLVCIFSSSAESHKTVECCRGTFLLIVRLWKKQYLNIYLILYSLSIRPKNMGSHAWVLKVTLRNCSQRPVRKQFASTRRIFFGLCCNIMVHLIKRTYMVWIYGTAKKTIHNHLQPWTFHVVVLLTC